MKPLAQLPAPAFPGKNPTITTVLSGLDLTEQDKLFVELCHQTGDAMASAVRAKMSDPAYPIDVLAMKTLERPDIQRALELLDAEERKGAAASTEVRPPVQVTKEVIMADLQDVFEAAKADKAYGAAIAAKKVQSSLGGWLKQEVNVNFRMTVEELPDEELLKIAKAGKTIDVDYEDVTDKKQ